MASEMASEASSGVSSEVYPLASELSQNGRCGLFRDVGESCEEWKSRLESRWGSIIHKTRAATGMHILKGTNTMDAPHFIDGIEVFEDEFRVIIMRDDWEVFLYLISYLLRLEFKIDVNEIWLRISKHDAIKIARVITIRDLPITIKGLPITESTLPSFLNTAAWHHSFQVVEFLLSAGADIYSGSQVEHCLDIALSSAWATLENVTSVVCSKKSPEKAINCLKLIATLCLPQMKPALSTLDCFACFMSDEVVAKEACNRAMQGRFLDYALLLMVAPGKVLDFIYRNSFLDVLKSKMSLSKWPVVFRACIFLFDIFSSVDYHFYKLWQSSEGLTQKGVVHHVYSTCCRAGLPVHYNDIKLLDAHTLCPQPKLSDVVDAKFAGPTTYPRILRPDHLQKNIYPISFECELLSIRNIPCWATDDICSCLKCRMAREVPKCLYPEGISQIKWTAREVPKCRPERISQIKWIEVPKCLYPEGISQIKWNWGCDLFRDVGESCEQWKSRLESRWDSIIRKVQATGISILKDFSDFSTNTPCCIDVIEVFEDEFRRIIGRDDWEVFLYLTSFLLGLKYNINDDIIWLWISEHDAIKIANVIMIKDLPITLESTSSLLDAAASHHSFQVAEFLLNTSIYSDTQVERSLDIALSCAWGTLENVTSVVCSKKSPEEAINCFKLIATLCLPQMKPALSTLDCFACFMSDEVVAKEACNRAKQGRFLDYALILMVAPGKVLDFTDRRSFLDGLRSEEMSSEWPVVFRTCLSLFDIFSSVDHDLYELWQSSEMLTQEGIVHAVYSTCRGAGLSVPCDINLLDAHTLCQQPKLSDVRRSSGYLRKNIYPKSFEFKLLPTRNNPCWATCDKPNHMGTTGETTPSH